MHRKKIKLVLVNFLLTIFHRTKSNQLPIYIILSKVLYTPSIMYSYIHHKRKINFSLTHPIVSTCPIYNFFLLFLLCFLFLFSITCYTILHRQPSSFVPLQILLFSLFFLYKKNNFFFCVLVGKTFHVYTSKLKTKVLEVIFFLPNQPTNTITFRAYVW